MALDLRQVKRVWLVVILAGLIPSHAFAILGDGFRFGRIQVTPTVESSLGYDSNVLFSNGSPEPDFFLLAEPGVRFATKGNRLQFESGYRYAREQFFSITEQNTNSHDGSFAIAYRRYRFAIEATEQVKFTKDPLDADILERVDRFENKASFAFIWYTPARDLEVEAKYTNSYRQFGGDLDQLTSFEDLVVITSKFNVSSFFRFLPKTAFRGSIQYSDIRFPNAGATERDGGQGFAINGGLEGRITPRLSIKTDVGFNQHNYSTGPSATRGSAGLSAEYGWKVWSFNLGVERRVEDALFTNFRDVTSFQYSASWIPRHKKYGLDVGGYVDFVDYSGNGILFNGATRSDTVMNLKAKFSYRFRPYLDFFSSYELWARDSNATNIVTGEDSASFTKHRVLLGVVFKL